MHNVANRDAYPAHRRHRQPLLLLGNGRHQRCGQVREEDAYLNVRRQFLNRAGQPIGHTPSARMIWWWSKSPCKPPARPATFTTWPSPTCSPPAWKSRTRASAPSANCTWATDAAQPDYLDLRDDRINLFTTATAEPKSFYYVARAVSKARL
ncbi:MAG: hypothetical protein WKG07_27605 [Hymenobacter sp.]